MQREDQAQGSSKMSGDMSQGTLLLMKQLKGAFLPGAAPPAQACRARGTRRVTHFLRPL